MLSGILIVQDLSGGLHNELEGQSTQHFAEAGPFNFLVATWFIPAPTAYQSARLVTMIVKVDKMSVSDASLHTMMQVGRCKIRHFAEASPGIARLASSGLACSLEVAGATRR